MGNFTNCIQQQPSPRGLTSTAPSFIENYARSHHRSSTSSRFRSLQSHNINALIDETLSIIRTVVDTDQEPPHAMLLVSRIANREDRWLEVMVALIERVPIKDPLGATVIALLLDECSLPSKELLQQLIRRVCSENRPRIKLLQTILDEYIKENSDQAIRGNDEGDQTARAVPESTLEVATEHQRNSTNQWRVNETSDVNNRRKIEHDLSCERNTLVLLACLAEKLVGPTSSSMLNTTAQAFIIDRVYLGMHGYSQLSASDFDATNTQSVSSSVLKVILFALIALEKFSHTSESKYILLQSLTITTEHSKMNVLQYYESWATSNNCLKRQIGFYAQWLLDNVFVLEHRQPSYEILDQHHVNVMLNDKDVSEYLKIGPDGLEARSDTVSFESVRCTYHVNADVWYYEVTIVTDGVMQIGWATKQSKFLNHEGYGIGDDHHSIAYDGCRNLIWFGAKSIPHQNPAWKPGDIVGCLIDFNRREVIFSLNGRSLDPFRKLFTFASETDNDGYFAAASFMSYQHCRFNFGSRPFRYPPTSVVSFKTFNDFAHLSDDDKLILPKYKKLALLRATEISDLDCTLCVDDQANVILKPCGHTGFCYQCSLKLDLCPICRTEIRERALIAAT